MPHTLGEELLKTQVLDVLLTLMTTLKHRHGSLPGNQPPATGLAIHPHPQIALPIHPVPSQVMPTQAHGFGALSYTGIEQELGIVTDQGSHLGFHAPV